MARIPDEVVERLKEEVDLVALVIRSGVALKKTGKDLVGSCPFHDDGTPSLVVTPSKGLWHCMGACQTGGTVIDWVMKSQGVSFRHAVELLRADAIPVVAPGKVVRVGTVRHLAAPVTTESDDAEALAQVVAYYHATLTESPEALAYLARRRIDDPVAIERFGLGYANRTLGLRLPAKNRKAGAEIRGRLQRLGVYRSSGHEHLAGSMVVPVHDTAGTVTELYGRKLLPNLRQGTPLHLYLPGPHRGVWNDEGLSGGEVIVCESLIDALSFYSAGFSNVTASYGTAGFTDDHRSAFARHGVTRCLIAYDADQPGEAAAGALATDLMATGIECFRVVLPVGCDVNDVAVAADDPRDALSRLIRAARWMGSGPGPGKGATEPPAPTAPGVVPSAASPPPVTEPEQLPEPSPPPTSPVPAAPSPPATAVTHDELVVELAARRWRVRHIPKSTGPGALRVNVMVAAGERFHVDTLDLYSAKARAAYAESAARELHTDAELLRGELGQVLLATEDAQAALATPTDDAIPAMSPAEREHAMELLCSADLIDQVGRAFEILGVVGERDSALVAWLTLTSRLSDRPLGAVIQSSSSAGKSTLADAVLSLVPDEAKVSYSAMTGQALYYLGETDLAHRVLAIAEEEGAARATYALKLLVSEGRLAIAAAGKDPVSGRLTTHTYEVNGPVALLMTTTAAELDEELANRLLVLSVDEGRRQTRAVQAAQRDAETLEGLVARTRRAELVARHHAAQRLLAPVAVVNPHAPSLRFSDRATRHRRDNAKYLGLIRAVALAHQHQRPRRQVQVEGRTVTYIEATETDVEVAERLCAQVLTTTTDELAPATRKLLGAIVDYTTEHGTRFTRRSLRATVGMGDSQLKVHLARLVDLEYLGCERAGPGTSYDLLCDEPAERPGARGDRPGENTDRPGIGRSADQGRPGIGRGVSQSDTEPSSQSEEPIAAENLDRPGAGQLRVVGDGGSVAHVGA